MGCCQDFKEVHCWIVETVCVDAFGSQQVVVGVDVDVNCVFVELVKIWLHCP